MDNILKYSEAKLRILMAVSIFAFASSAQALSYPGTVDGRPQPVAVQDFSVCTWNVLVENPSEGTANEIRNFISQYGIIKGSSTKAVGFLILEVQFDLSNYSTRADAQAAAQDAANKLKSQKGVEVVCQVNHANKNPRLSGGT